MRKCLFLVLLFLFSNTSEAQFFRAPGQLTTEEDGSPDIRCLKYKFANGNVTDNGDGTCSIEDNQTFNEIGDPSSDTSIDFTTFTNAWTSTGSSGEFFSIGNATNGGIFSVDRSGKVVLGDNTDFRAVSIRPPQTSSITSSTTDFSPNAANYQTDGTADDVQIQAALDDIFNGAAKGATQGGGSGKGRLTLSEGNYNISNSINPTPGITTQGTGITSTVWKAISGLNEPMICIESTENPNAGYIFRDMYFDGNQTSGTQTNTKGIDALCGSGTVAAWDIQLIDTYWFDWKAVVWDLASTWGSRAYNNHIEDSDGKAVVVSNDGTKTTGLIHAINKIIQNDTAYTFAAGLQGNIVGLSEINCDVANCYSFDWNGADFNINIANSTLGQGALSGSDANGDIFRSGALYNKTIGRTIAGITGTAFTVASGGNYNTIALSHCGNNAVGGTCLSDSGTGTLVFGVTDDGVATGWATDKLPAPFDWNPGQQAINGTWYSDNGVIMAVVGAVDQVRMGDGSTNYTYFDADGDLQFAGTADYLVADNAFSFRAAADQDGGLRFGDGRFQFIGVGANAGVVDGDGEEIVSINVLESSNGVIGIGYTAPSDALNVNGNIGIGTSVASQELDIIGEIEITGNSNTCTITVDADGTCDAGTAMVLDNSIAICAVCS